MAVWRQYWERSWRRRYRCLIKFKHGAVDVCYRGKPLVFCAFCVEHCNEHVAISISFGLVSTQYFAKSWGRWLFKGMPSGRKESFHCGVRTLR